MDEKEFECFFGSQTKGGNLKSTVPDIIAIGLDKKERESGVFISVNIIHSDNEI